LKGKSQAARNALQEFERQSDVVLEEIGRALDQANAYTTGIGSVANFVPGSPQYDLAQTLNTIKANVGFDKLQAMRDASPTGGALGQVSEMENRLLQSVLGSIEQAQSKEQLRYNLRRLRKILQDRRETRREAYQRDFSVVTTEDGGGQDDIDALLEKYGE